MSAPKLKTWTMTLLYKTRLVLLIVTEFLLTLISGTENIQWFKQIHDFSVQKNMQSSFDNWKLPRINGLIKLTNMFSGSGDSLHRFVPRPSSQLAIPTVCGHAHDCLGLCNVWLGDHHMRRLHYRKVLEGHVSFFKNIFLI